MSLFTTEQERQEYFLRLESDSCSVEFGAAMEHAISTNLGAWGSEEELKRDCAEIMKAEVIKFSQQDRWSLFSFGNEPTIHQVMTDSAFSVWFDHARLPNQADAHNLVRSLGANARSMKPVDGTLTPRWAQQLAAAHKSVFYSLRIGRSFPLLPLLSAREGLM